MRSVLLSHHWWYAATWTVVLALYGLRLSIFDVPLNNGLMTFFVVTIAVSVLLGLIERRRVESLAPFDPVAPSVQTLTWVRRALLALIVVVTMLDWRYRGGIPLFSGVEYEGFDPAATVQARIGIPYVHVAVVALTVFYAIYVGYLCATTNRPGLWIQLAVCVGLLILSQGRGFAIFALFTLAIFIARRRWRPARAGASLRLLLSLVVGLLGIAVVMGILGNVRLGVRWSDYTRFKAIAGIDSSGSGPLDWLSWVYTYLTSPVANLSLRTQYTPDDPSMRHVLSAFVPATFTQPPAPTALSRTYVVDYLNASTGFSDFYSAGGLAGLYIAFAVMLMYFALWAAIARRVGHVTEVMRGVFVLFVGTTVFYNPFSNAALAYAPLLVILAGFVHRRAAGAANSGLSLESAWLTS